MKIVQVTKYVKNGKNRVAITVMNGRNKTVCHMTVKQFANWNKGIDADDIIGMPCDVIFFPIGHELTDINGNVTGTVTSDDSIVDIFNVITSARAITYAATADAIYRTMQVPVVRSVVKNENRNPEAEILERISTMEDAQDVTDFNADFGTVTLTSATKSLLDAKIAAIMPAVTPLMFKGIEVVDQDSFEEAIAAGLTGTKLTKMVADLAARNIEVTA
jgi:hypothetical protein